jgi:hypothetical protein
MYRDKEKWFCGTRVFAGTRLAVRDYRFAPSCERAYRNGVPVVKKGFLDSLKE